ncbi:MAG TPA: phenylacetic acid degradation b [Cyclobacteriaceae bacterium]
MQQGMESLDPRVNRLPKIESHESFSTIKPLDQLGTYEVFVQPKTGKPFQHEGCVHASDVELAYILAKETYTRRFTCASLCVVETQRVFVSPFTEGEQSAYSLIDETIVTDGAEIEFEIYHLLKRGKQHIHAGSIVAHNETGAFQKAHIAFATDKPVYNIWCIAKRDIRFTKPEEEDLWMTLPEKKFRDAIDYKGGDKLKSFLENINHSS